MTMRVYIAGGSSERESCASMIAKAQALGLHITYDWTKDWSADKTRAEWIRKAQADLVGVKTAHVVWCMVPEALSEGMATELGFALALGRRVVLSGPQRPIDPFHRLVERSFALHSTALDWVVLEATKYNGY